MRGLRSSHRAARRRGWPLGGYLPCVRIEDASRGDDKKQEKVFAASRPTRSIRSRSSRKRARRRRSQKQDGKWQMTQPARGGGRRSGDLGHHVEPRLARGVSGSSTRRRPTSSSTASIPRDRGRLQGRRPGSAPADRAEDADRQRPLRAGCADKPRVFLISSYLESTFNKSHVRSARQDGPEVRSRQGRRVSRSRRRTDASSSPSSGPTGR